MKKIALLHYAYPPNIGGVEIFLKEQAYLLNELGYEVTILTGEGEETNPQIKLIKNPYFQSIQNINPQLQEKILEKGVIDYEFHQVADKIRKILNSYLKEIEIIIIHNMLTVYRNLPFIYAFHQFTQENPLKKIIVWVHDHMYVGEEKIKDLSKYKDLGKTSLEKKLLTTPIPNAFYVVISETFKNLLINVMKLNPSLVKVIPNGINLKKFLEIDEPIWKLVKKYFLLESLPLILSPVNILERKNIEYSIEIIYHLKKFYPKVKYLITGQPSKHRNTTWYQEKLINLINQLKIEEKIIFLKEDLNRALNDSEIHDLYQLSDLIFYFSRSENFGLPILESSLAKTPIFVSNLKVFHEVSGEFINYIDYQKTSPEQAAKNIKEFIEKNPLIKSNYLMRTKYNLENIIKNELIPLIEEK